MKNSKSYLFLSIFILQLLTIASPIQSVHLFHASSVTELKSPHVLSESHETISSTSLIESSFPSINLQQESRPTIAWIRQISSPGLDKGNEKISSTAIDETGSIIVAGTTDGGLFSKSIGGADAFVAKFDTAGNTIWSTQFGSNGLDTAVSVVTDKSGNIYVAGYSSHILSDNRPNPLGLTTYLRKYDSSGKERWTIQFGADPYDEFGSISLDSSGNIYVVGSKFVRTDGNGPDYKRGFLSKYDSDGNELWTRMFEFPDSSNAKSVAVSSSGDIYIGGQNIKLDSYPFGNIDALLKKFDSKGNEIWTRKFGASDAEDRINSVTVDSSGNIYAAGLTYADVFLRKYDSAGNLLWARQFGAYGGAEAFSVSTDISGNVHVAGVINNYTRDQVRSEGDDAFVKKYDASGNELWDNQFGTGSRDIAYSVTIDRSGNIYAAGSTEGAFPGQQYPSNTDAFLVKIAQPAIPAPVPAPSPTPSPSPSQVPAPEPLPPPAPETSPSPEQPPGAEPPASDEPSND